MQDQVVVITGATGGIGRESARQLAQRGARLILTARDRTRGEQVAEQLRSQCDSPEIAVICIDFASMRSIREGAAEIIARAPALDVLLNNAGAMHSERLLSEDQLEMSFAVNHLGYFLLTSLLLPALKKAPKARVVNVSSDAHWLALSGITFDDLNREKSYSGLQVYAESKLMNILFTRELARRLKGSSVTANCLHPGVIGSSFAHNTSGMLGYLARTFGPRVLTSTERGAKTSVYLCSAKEVDGQSGGYYYRCKPHVLSPAARDDQAARRLWALSEDLCAV